MKLHENRMLSYMLLIIANTLVGAASGLFSPASAVRGGLLGFCLGMATSILNYRNGDKLDSRTTLTRGPVYAVSTAVSCIYVLLVLAAFSIFKFRPREFDFAKLDNLSLLILGFLYLLGFQAAYPKRFHYNSLVILKTLGLVILAALGCTLVRGVVGMNQNFSSELPINPLSGFPFFFLFGALPFALGWFISSLAFDPAWSFERWALGKKTVRA